MSPPHPCSKTSLKEDNLYQEKRFMNASIASPSTRNASAETRWTRGAWLTLIAAGLFLVLNIVQVAYRFTIPSVGWVNFDPTAQDLSYFQLQFNAVGAPSLLQPGDIVRNIGGFPAAQILDDPLVPRSLPEDWRVGGKVWVTVSREGQLLEFEVPLVHWTLRAWWSTNFGNFSALWNWLTTFLLFGVGVFTFFNRPGNLGARFLFAFGLAFLSITLGASVKDSLALIFNFPAAFASAFFVNIIFAYLLGPSFLDFTLTFPRPKGFIQRVGCSCRILLVSLPSCC
jgi:hypothetical protein